MLVLLVIFFTIKLYARINIYNVGGKSTTTFQERIQDSPKTSKMDRIARWTKSQQKLTAFSVINFSILDVCASPGYTSALFVT